MNKFTSIFSQMLTLFPRIVIHIYIKGIPFC